MSRWFRHYAGMMRDEKLVRIAIKTGQPIERVLWVWGAILESAAEIDDNGRYDFEPEEAAYFLRADKGDIDAILDSLSAMARLREGCVVNWGNRQFKSDRSAERQSAYRERKRQQERDIDESAQRKREGSQRNKGVTSPSRHGDAPETETETDIPLSNDNGRAAPDSDKEFWDGAVAYLGGKRSLIGKWAKEYGKPETAKAITAAQLDRAVDPPSFIERTLRNGKARASPEFTSPC